jgi:hypothetical protein
MLTMASRRIVAWQNILSYAIIRLLG